MAKPFKTLLDQMPQERRERIADRTQDLLIEMALQELRQSRNLTQQQVADALGISQAAFSKMEHQSDIQISTLRRILVAMGGELKLVAHFPDGEFIISPQP
ncbi:MAG: XRE family transcriptional regulator [Anaerolineae bacterium]|nr:XRE family transcriptional regulator [Anaerolineae bacterium]